MDIVFVEDTIISHEREVMCDLYLRTTSIIQERLKLNVEMLSTKPVWILALNDEFINLQVLDM